jgi:hypothetical protein
VENRKAGGQRLAARRSDRPTPAARVTTGEAAMRHPDKQKRESPGTDATRSGLSDSAFSSLFVGPGFYEIWPNIRNQARKLRTL